MKKQIDKVNFILFPFIQIFALIVSILESYKYLGFFQKHFYISAYLIYLASFISFVVLAKSNVLLEEIRKRQLLRIFYGFYTVVFIISVLLYLYFNESEINHYQNFSYATFHIWPGSLIFSVALLFETAFLFFAANHNFTELDRKFYRKFRKCILLHFKGIRLRNFK